MKEFLKRLFCNHDYKMVKGTTHMIHAGMSKGAKFRCQKCGKEIWSDIFWKRVNK